MNANTITIGQLEEIADELSHFAYRINRLADDASDGEYSPEEATTKLASILDDVSDFCTEHKPTLP